MSQWLIGNPNRVNLGRIGLRYHQETLSADDISDTHQELDLWNGVITSTFTVAGSRVKVMTQGDFESDAVAFNVESNLIESGDLFVEFDFPYPPIHTEKYKYEVFVGVYDFPANHTTKLVSGCKKNTAHVHHDLANGYYVNVRWPDEAPLGLNRLEPSNSTAITAHRYVLSPADDVSTISFTAEFARHKKVPDLPSEIQKRNSIDWHDYWEEGGFVDLTESSNPNATELQRRIVTSQYHVRVNSAATGESPQESGLMNNGWYGMYTICSAAHVISPTTLTIEQASFTWRWSSGTARTGCPGAARSTSTTSSQPLTRSSWKPRSTEPPRWAGRELGGPR